MDDDKNVKVSGLVEGAARKGHADEKRVRSDESGAQRDRSRALAAYKRGCKLFGQWEKSDWPRNILNESIAWFERSLKQRPSDDFGTWKAQEKLSNALYLRWMWYGREDVTDLNRSIDLYFRALADCPPDHLHELHDVECYRIQEWAGAEVKTLSEALERCRIKIDKLSLDHPRRTLLLELLAKLQVLLLEYDSATDLSRSVDLRTTILANISIGHPDRLWLEYFLAQRLFYFRSGREAQESTDLRTAALNNMSPDHPDRRWIQMYLVLGLLHCYSGGLSSLLRIRTLQTAVLEHIPADHPVHSSFLTLLRDSQERLFKKIEQEKSDNGLVIELITNPLEVALPDHHDHPTYQSLLAKKHLERRHDEKNAADLDRSIKLLEGSFQEITGDRCREDHFLLASALRKRGNILRDVNDFDRSIKIFEVLVEDPPWPYKELVKPGLVLAIARRWNLIPDGTHLKRFMQLFEAGIDPFQRLGLDHPQIHWLDDETTDNYINMIKGDRDLAIKLMTRVFETFTLSHEDRSKCQFYLGKWHLERWQQNKDAAHLNRAIEILEASLEENARSRNEGQQQDPKGPESSLFLAICLYQRSRLRPQIAQAGADLGRSIEIFRSILTDDTTSDELKATPRQILQHVLSSSADSLGSLNISVSGLQELRAIARERFVFLDVLILQGVLEECKKSRNQCDMGKAVEAAIELFQSVSHDHSRIAEAVTLVARTVVHLVNLYDKSGRLLPLEQADLLIQSCITILPSEHPDVHILEDCHATVHSRRVPQIVVSMETDTSVGEGGFGDVYRGIFEGGLVAMKTPKVKLGNEVKTMWFLREIYLWHRLCHPHILRIFGVYEEKNTLYVISPWCANGDCISYMKEHADFNRLLLLCQVSEAIQYLHQFSPVVVHGDIKGENVLIDDNGAALLCDFGISRLEISPESLGFTRTATSLATLGTFKFMAPELFSPDEEDHNGVRKWSKTTKSDVYAFGCFIYQVMTGKHPFSQFRLDFQVINQVMLGRRPGRTQEFESLDELWSLCTDCWAQEPASRPIIVEVLRRLRDIQSVFS